MKRIRSCSVCLMLMLGMIGGPQALASRLIILADMGNEPDEVQQMAHMIMCSNEFELEGLIAVSGIYLRPESKDPYRRVLHPELFAEIIDAYAKVYPNLQKHASGWRSPEYLHSIVTTGQPGYGFEAVGEGKSSPGSELIIKAVTKDDTRPLWIVVNAGSNTLAQALHDYQATHSQSEVDAFVARLRVFENGAQDNCGAWICNRFPNIHWLRSNYQTYCYGGPSHEGAINHTGDRQAIGPHTWEPYAYSFIGQHQWALEHIKGNHGPLGKVWPVRQFGNGHISFLEGGGTIPWLGLVNKGLFSIDHPHWRGWSGRFSREKVQNYMSKHKRVREDEEKVGDFSLYKEAADRWINPENGDEYNDVFTPVWRWRRAFFNNFKCRMDWCLNPYDKANHHPAAAFQGDRSNAIIRRQAKPGQTIRLDASATTDPDGDRVDIRWYTYPEAGTYDGNVTILGSEQARAGVIIPADAAGKQIHVILEVKDLNPIASLFDYRRVVIDVESTPVTSKTLYRDDFEENLDNWVVEQMPGGSVRVNGGKLEIDDAKGCTVWFREKLDGPIMIEYEAVIIKKGGPRDRGSDLNCFWMAQDPEHYGDLFASSQKRGGRFTNYNSLRLYYVGYGANDNTTTRFRRYPGTGEKPLLPEHDLRDDEYMLKYNVPIKIRLIADGRRIAYLRDGEIVFDVVDPDPFTDGWFGFRTVNNHMTIDNFRIYRLGNPVR